MLLMILLVQALSLVAFARFHRTTVLRLAVLRQQLAVYKHSAKKPRLKSRDRLFSFCHLKGVERLAVRVDPCEAGDGDPMEKAEVSGVLAEEIRKHDREARHS